MLLNASFFFFMYFPGVLTVLFSTYYIENKKKHFIYKEI
jgi:hypothetical protein